MCYVGWMSRLIYIAGMSLDGYIEDQSGAFDWVDPSGVHEFITGLVRPMQTHLYGRRLYETMAYWDAPAIDEYPAEQRDFARVWQKTQKIVYSRTLTAPTTRNTRLEAEFDADAIRKLKQESAHDMLVGGAELAGIAIAAGVVDECHVFINPVVVGRGKPAFGVDLRQNLALIATRRFDTGVVHVRYRLI